MSNRAPGGLFVVSAPSGCGKTILTRASIDALAKAGITAEISVSYTTRAPRPGEQDPGLLERLPHRGAHERPGHVLVGAEPVGPLGRRGPGPADRRVEVTGVHATAGEDEHAARELHGDLATQEVDDGALVRGPEQDHGRGVAWLDGRACALGVLLGDVGEPRRQRHRREGDLHGAVLTRGRRSRR